MQKHHSFEVANRRLSEAKEKDRILDLVGGEIIRRKLRTTDLRAIVPTISPRMVSDIRAGVRTAASMEPLHRLAAGLGLMEMAA